MKKLIVVLCAVSALSVLFILAMSYVATDRPDPGLRGPVAVRGTPFAQKHVVVDGMRIRYVDEGAGEPVLVIHGHTSRIEENDHLIGSLRDRFRVIALDLPGSGYSDKPDREYGLEFYEDVLVRFLDVLRIERCHVAGGSMGGNLALRLAYRFPGRVLRVVAWSPAGAWESKSVTARVMRAVGGRALFLPVVSVQSTYWYSDDYPEKEVMLRNTVTYYDEVLSPGFVRMYWGLAADQMGESLFPLAPDIRHHALLLWGDQDDGLGMGDGLARMQRLMPHAELRVFKGAGHALGTEREDDVAAAVMEFLTRTPERLP